MVSGATSSTGHALVDIAQLAGAVADLAARSSRFESGLLTMQQMVGQMMLAHQSHATQVADSLARLSAHHYDEAAVGASIQSYDEEYDMGGAGVNGGGDTFVPDGFSGDASNTVGSGGAVGLVPPPLPPSSGASVGLAPAPGPAVPSGPVADASRGIAGGIAGIQPRATSFPSAAGVVVSGASSSHLVRVAGGLVTPIAQAHRVGIPGAAAAVTSASPGSIHSFSSWQEPRTIAQGGGSSSGSARGVPFPGFSPEQLTFLQGLAAQGLVSLPGSSGGAAAAKAPPVEPTQSSGRGGRGGGGIGRGGGGAGRGGGRGGHNGGSKRGESGVNPHHSA